MKKAISWTLLLFVLVAVVVGGIVVPPLGGMASGYYAKLLCSGVFVSGRAAEQVLAEDLKLDNPLSSLVSVRVLDEQAATQASFIGLVKRTAVYRKGLGCTIIAGYAEDAVTAQPIPDGLSIAPDSVESPPWPLGGADIQYPMPARVDSSLLAVAVEEAFVESNPERPARTRAVAVAYRGQMVAEQYGEGWSRDMPLQAWSMTKSITNALIGIRVGEGRLDVDAPAPIPQWAADERAAITLEHLLHMSSGLSFEEEYFNPLADAPQMLFNRAATGVYAAQRELANEPGSHWAYSSGTTNILQELLRDTFEDRFGAYWEYPHKALFDRIGAYSAVIEPDASGTFVGSSFMYATARDWARFGQLYLQDGRWDGEQIFPEGWVEYSTTPAPAAPRGQYGAQIWLNAGDADEPENRFWPTLPTDTFFFSGFDEQYVVVFPSYELVVVRLGLTQDWRAWSQESFLRSVLDAFTQPASPVDHEEG